MKIIIVQGMECLGKTTLSERLGNMLPKSKVYCLDKYKEVLCDRLGFANVEERAKLYELAQDDMYEELREAVTAGRYDYYIIDATFVDSYVTRLTSFLSYAAVYADIVTVYLNVDNKEEHKALWERQHLDITRRHPSHGATSYLHGDGCGYTSDYESVYHTMLPIFGDTIPVRVKFDPFSLDVAYEDICEYIRG